MKQAMRHITRRSARSLCDWPAELTRSEGQWSRRPDCPLLPRAIASTGFLRDRLHVMTGAVPLPLRLSDESVDATLSLMLRRGSR
ncbi:hypothetical protein [Azospirillum halopraeferens]|uniref:hypothetical protein n=1 Tax=Azospirillum halopraeferens TaxID=34010 RepID=UPI0003F5EB58|nr:hypothetical protein [Azospirillum halopraeferens]